MISFIIPEMILLSLAFVHLLSHVWLNSRRFESLRFWITQLALIFSAIFSMHHLNMKRVYIFDHMMTFDPLGQSLRMIILFSCIFLLAYRHFGLSKRKEQRQDGQSMCLILFAIIGMLVAVSSRNILIIYLGLEMFSLPLYALIAQDNGQHSNLSEASIKYFIMGALASGFILFGFALIYATTHSLDLGTIALWVITHLKYYHMILPIAAASIFMFAGICFKLGLAPCHSWVPDVYQGTTAENTLVVATVPKIASWGILVRLFVGTIGTLHHQWFLLLSIVAIVSIILGNLFAITQRNIRRLLGYSSIAHMGYATLGLLMINPAGIASSFFYMIIYVLSSLLAFGILAMLERDKHEFILIKDLKGFSSRCPDLAFMMMIAMFSMAGIPPLAGFMAKFSVLNTLITSHHRTLLILAIIAVIMSVLGAFYYINIIRQMYFENAPEGQMNKIAANSFGKSILTFNSLLIIGFGIMPSMVMGFALHQVA